MQQFLNVTLRVFLLLEVAQVLARLDPVAAQVLLIGYPHLHVFDALHDYLVLAVYSLRKLLILLEG